MIRLATTVLLALGALAAPAAAQTGKTSSGAGPVIVVETSKGTIEFETYPNEAPKTVAHITALARRKFYDGTRIHRVVKGFVVQFGDPQSRDMTKKDLWGTGCSGKPIGVGEISPKRTHTRGAVAMAYAGDPAKADSQMYITLAPQPGLDGKYTVFGNVTSGMDVVDKLEIGDVVKRVTVKDGSSPAKK